MHNKDHWEHVYTTKATDAISGVQTHATPFGTQQQFVYCYCRKALD